VSLGFFLPTLDTLRLFVSELGLVKLSDEFLTECNRKTNGHIGCIENNNVDCAHLFSLQTGSRLRMQCVLVLLYFRADSRLDHDGD